MEAGIIIATSVLIGVIVINIFVYVVLNKRNVSQGILNVDCSDPEDGPYLFLELKVPVSDIVSRKQVIFDVSMKNYVSQK